MGMTALYAEVNINQIDRFKKGISDELLEELQDAIEDEEIDSFDIDKMWDGLHCLLTGVSAVNMISGNPLSEAVMGTEILSTKDDYEYIACIYPDRLKEIVKAFDDINVEELGKNFSPRLFAENGIYPDIWMYEAEDGLRKELLTAFEELREFYRTVAEKNNGIIIELG